MKTTLSLSLAAALLLPACGRAPDCTVGPAERPWFHAYRVAADSPSCELIDARLSAARETLVPALISPENFDETFQAYPINVHNVWALAGTPETVSTVGMTSFAGAEVHLGNDLLGAAHELMHVWDARHMAPGTLWHAGWAENRYYETIMLYECAVFPRVMGCRQLREGK
jgi:hypothetical protein